MQNKLKHMIGVAAIVAAGAMTTWAQAPAVNTPKREPSKATREVVVLSGQSLADLNKRLHPDNKVEELFGGAGVELRVAVQHEKNTAPASGELHDNSDDIYYVLEGSATLTLGGTIETPREVSPGEWRGPKIIGGKQIEIAQGDLVVVPRGTPHQRSTVGKDFTMILIKVYTGGMPAPAPKPAVPAEPKKP
ncbi:MAG: hypothetical protein ABIP75_03730 [Pyrinomonadaceae bacterium]